MEGSPTRRTSGFTMLELVVAIAVLAVLTSLLLPAIQASREASRQMSCRENLRQLSMALQIRMEDDSVTASNPRDGLPTLLQYLEQQDLASLPPGSRPGLPIFLCPSDSQSSISEAGFNYIFNGGNRIAEAKMNGIVLSDYNSLVRPIDIQDGMSQTAAISERLYSLSLRQLGNSLASFEADAKRYTWYMSTPVPPGATEAEFADACHKSRVTPTSSPLHLAAPLGYHFHPYSHLLGPNEIGCYNASPLLPQFSNFAHGVTATSLHVGGVNVAYCDGHVSLVSDAIDIGIWNALGSRSDHDAIGAAFP